MGLKNYVESYGLEDEPTGLIVLAACGSGEIESAGPPLNADELLERIGINEGDTLDTLRSKISFALKWVGTGSMAESLTVVLPSKDPEHLANYEETFGRPLSLEDIKRGQLLDRLSGGDKPLSPAVIAEDMSKLTSEEVLELEDARVINGWRKTLRRVLEWLDN